MSLRIGSIAGFIILKSLPDYDSYLCKLIDSQFLTLLPKKWARKEYKVGESDWAAVFDMKGPRITLSQKSPHYIRKILEYLLLPACTELHLKFKKIAWVNGFYYHKVAVEPLNNDIKDSIELHSVLTPYLEKINLREYFSENISFVRYSWDLKEYVVNALCPPGRPDKIFKVIHHKEMNTVDVLADNSTIGFLLGTKGKNLIVASKLCQCGIDIKPISIETFTRFTETLKL